MYYPLYCLTQTRDLLCLSFPRTPTDFSSCFIFFTPPLQSSSHDSSEKLIAYIQKCHSYMMVDIYPNSFIIPSSSSIQLVRKFLKNSASSPSFPGDLLLSFCLELTSLVTSHDSISPFHSPSSTLSSFTLCVVISPLILSSLSASRSFLKSRVHSCLGSWSEVWYGLPEGIKLNGRMIVALI